MGAADEIAFMYAVNRAYFPAFTARSTFVIIYAGEIVYYFDCLGGTSLFALAASYTTVFAELSYLCALVVIITLNNGAGNVLYKMDYAIGASRSAKAAAYTLFGIYLGYTTLGDAYSISWANLSAVAISKTSEGAESIACEVHICGFTGLRTCVDVLSFLGLASSVTRNESNLLDNVLCLNTEDCRNSLRSSVTAGSTEIRLIGYALGKSLCISLTAGKAASTAVCSGKTVTYLCSFFILFDTEIT